MSTLNFDGTKLAILEDFEIDFSLAKWKSRRVDGEDWHKFTMYNRVNRISGGNFITSGIMISGGGDFITGAPIKRENKFMRFIKQTNFWHAFIGSNKNVDKKIDPLELITEPPVELSIEAFFTSVKNSAEELTIVKNRVDGYVKALEKLNSLGQTALYETMKVEVEIHKAEAQLDAIGMKKYITEDSIIQFIRKSEKSLRLDWIKNFVRMIPDDVADKKIKADERHIFDNYVILHYDPNNTGRELTTEEKEKMLDPILFGVLVGSRKLYFIGDWIDEHCDLTLNEVIKHLGESHIKEV